MLAIVFKAVYTFLDAFAKFEAAGSITINRNQHRYRRFNSCGLQLTIRKRGKRHGNSNLLKLNFGESILDRKEKLPCLRRIITIR
jgi:hypothetical protein